EQPPATPYQPLQTDQPPPSTPPPGKAPVSDYVDIAPWDNSNSQYGVLGVWAGAETGVEVPTKYWKAVQQHWQSCELKTGEWFYAWINPPQTPTPTLQMTCAGIASLLITHDYLDAPALGNRVGRPPYSPNLSTGLSWLESGDNVINVITENMFYVGYNLYGIERCALASGYKYFGTHDWFAELCGQVLPNQYPNGAWGRGPDGEAALIDTSYIVLFLSRGRHPVIMNKLRFDPFWDNRPRDLANLAKFASHELERPLNWQVVNLQRDWSDWMDAPILYIASHQAPKFTDEDYDKLRSFAEAGGMIFTHADSAAPAFNNWVDATTKRLFPQYALRDVPGDHELFSVNYKLKSPTHLKMVTNGTRLLWVHSPVDISPAWQERGFKTSLSTFQLGVNLFVWAAGRGDFRNRLDSPYIPQPSGDPQQTITVARLKYGDGPAWNPEPYAWTRFGRIVQTDTGTAVKTVDVDAKDLSAIGDYKIAALTGNAATDFTDDQIKAIASFVESGGTLLIDACGGSTDFATCIEQKLLPEAFPNTPMKLLPADDPIAKTAGAPAIRQYTVAKLGSADAPPVKQISFGKGRVIYSPLDLTTGLLGTNSWGIFGYTPTYSVALLKSIASAAQK
ncbi:MAG TPA: DUF4159 domain-containing protein, partial [Tepidisphaeraceae bacterium]|nr:DUF4159 domain-containing protein [Tepidisphaeraceae bacterium]